MVTYQNIYLGSRITYQSQHNSIDDFFILLNFLGKRILGVEFVRYLENLPI